jgi:hypothetical protein
MAKQTHVLTDDREKSAAELASRMFGRWSQENYFKYAGEHRDLDALVTQEMDQPTGRVVPNPERAKPESAACQSPCSATRGPRAA